MTMLIRSTWPESGNAMSVQMAVTPTADRYWRTRLGKCPAGGRRGGDDFDAGAEAFQSRQARILAEGEPAELGGRTNQNLRRLAQPRIAGDGGGRGRAVQRDRFRPEGGRDAKDLQAPGAIPIAHKAKTGSLHVDYHRDRVQCLGQAFACMDQVEVVAARANHDQQTFAR